MSSQSKAQQRLMGQAYAVKKGDISISDIDTEYRDKIQTLVDSMTLKQLKDYAQTKHKNLPDKKNENLVPGSVSGMGDVILPDNPGSLNSFDIQSSGSGDIPYSLDDILSNFNLLTFNQFIKKFKSNNRD